MPKTPSNFEELEKQLAKDALEKALKDLHAEITREIAKNKNTFSEEIKKSLSHLEETLENHISNEIDKKLKLYLEKNFSILESQVKERFEEMAFPIFKRTEEDMHLLQNQGEETLNSWKEMMSAYSSFWTRPFFLVILTSILTGVFISLFSYYFIGNTERRARQSCEETLQWYITKHFDMNKDEQESSIIKKDSSSQQKIKPKSKNKKPAK